VLFDLVFLVLLGNTIAAAPDRIRVLRSLLVIFGSAFVVKFIVLAALSRPAETPVTRGLRMLFEGLTLGSITQDVVHPASGYVAFCTLMLYFYGLMLLPASEPTDSEGGPDGPGRDSQPRALRAGDLVDP